MIRLGLIASAAIALVSLSGAANAASYNCYGNITYTERTICDNPGLSNADSRMSSLYFSDLNVSHGWQRQRLQSSQIRWLGWRNSCGANVACLWNAYNTRINQLSSGD